MRADDRRGDLLRAALGFARKLALHRIDDAPVQLAVRIDQRGRRLSGQIVGRGERSRGHRGRVSAALVEQRLEIPRGGHPVGFVAEMAAQVLALFELEVGHAAVGDQLEHAGDFFLLERREEFLRLIDVDRARVVLAGAGGVHPCELLHGRGAILQIAPLDLGPHALQRFRDGDDLATGRVERRGVHRFALPEEQQHALVGQVRREIAIDAPVAVPFGVRQQVFEMNEREAGAMNKPVHLRELDVREANRRIRQASGARAHRPPRRKLPKVLLDLLLERGRGIRAHERVDLAAILEE